MQGIKIKSIKPIGEFKTYDLTIKKNHNFIANNILTHNSAQRIIKSVKPDCFEDICAISALNRPGPLETFGDKFGVWKRKYLAGKEDDLLTDPLYPKLDFMREVTKNTYGVLLYQEQFMFMVQKACDMDLGECDNFRRCIGWKEDNPKYYQLEEYFKRLGTGMLAKGYAEEDTKYFVDYCRKFLGYSFNKSHSCLVNDTIIKTKHGDKKIIDIKKGDKVLSYNMKTGKNEYKNVKNFFDQGIKKTYQFKTKSGKIIKCTSDHIVYCEDGKERTIQECFDKKIKIRTFN